MKILTIRGLCDLTKNYRSVLLGVGLSVGARGIGAISGLVSVPLLLSHFGTQEYGVWVFILSISGMLSFMDFGIGNAILNRSARLIEANDRAGIKAIIASALAGFGILSLIFSSLFFLASRYLHLSSIINLNGADLDTALLVYLIYSSCTIPLAAVQRLQIGIGKGWINPLTNATLSLVGLAVIFFGCYASLELLPLVLVFAGTQWMICFLSVFLFLRSEDLTPSIEDINPKIFATLAREGAPFFLLQLAAIFGAQADNILIARYVGVEALASWSIAVKIFQLLSLVPSLINTYLWPMYTAAAARGDMQFIKRTLLTTGTSIFIYCTISGFLAAIGFPWITALWLDRTDIQAPLLLLAGLAFWLATESTGACIGTFLNARSDMRLQIFLGLIYGSGVLLSKAIALGFFGIVALPWATSLYYLLLHIPIYTWHLRRTLFRK